MWQRLRTLLQAPLPSAIDLPQQRLRCALLFYSYAPSTLISQASRNFLSSRASGRVFFYSSSFSHWKERQLTAGLQGYIPTTVVFISVLCSLIPRLSLLRRGEPGNEARLISVLSLVLHESEWTNYFVARHTIIEPKATEYISETTCHFTL